MRRAHDLLDDLIRPRQQRRRDRQTERLLPPDRISSSGPSTAHAAFQSPLPKGDPTGPIDVVRVVLQPLQITRTDRLARSVQHRQNNLDT